MSTIDRVTVTLPSELAETLRGLVADGEAASVSALVTEAVSGLVERREARQTAVRFEARRKLEDLSVSSPEAYEWGRGVVERLKERERGSAAA